jgi:PAS domain S-box-containing protein
MQAPLPGNETARLESLYQLNILDTLPQSDYDDIVLLASNICDTPIALITFVDRDRQWFKARVGLDLEETSRDISFCAHAILHPKEVMVVPDTLADERFCDSAVVTGAPHIRFYAGAPLVMNDGMALGTLCVLDTTPRELTVKQRTALSTLARTVVNTLELRRLSGERATRQTILYNILHQLTQEIDVDRILQKALLAIRQLNRWDAISISLPTADGDSWQTRIAYPAHEGRFDTYPITAGVIGRAYRTGQTQIVSNTNVDPDFFQGESVKLASSELAIPMKFDQHVLGVLNIDAYKPYAFTQDDVEFAQSIAEIIAIALNNAQQFVSLQNEIIRRTIVEEDLWEARAELEDKINARTQQLVQANAQLGTSLLNTNLLYQISQVLNASSSLDSSQGWQAKKAIVRIQQLIANTLGFDRVHIITFDVDNKLAHGFSKSGAGQEQIVNVTFDELWAGLSGWVLRERKPALSPNGYLDPRESAAVQKRRAETNCGAIVVVPILYEQKPLGTLTAINRPDQRDLNQADVDVLASVANQIAAVMEKNRLYTRLLNEILVRKQVEAELLEAKHTLENRVAQRTAELAAANAALTESELHFRTLANSGDALIWTSDPDNQCDYCNQIWLDFTGRSLEAELVHGWLEGIHPDDNERCRQIYSWAVARRERYNMEYRLRRHDGEYRWLQEHGTPRFNQSGEFVGYIGHCLDITERRQAEDEIRFQSNLLARVTQALIVIELEGTIRYWNKSAEGMYGWPAEEVLGKNIAQIIASPWTPEMLRQVETTISQGAPWTGELMVCHKNGDAFPVFVMATPYRDAVGNAEGVIGVFVDLSQRKQMEEAARINEIRFSTIFHQSPVAVAITDLNTNCLTDVNEAWLAFWGYTSAEVLGRTALDIGLWADPQDRERLIAELHKADHVTDFETTFCRKSGEKRDVLIYAGQIDLHEVPTMLIQILDITERKQAEQNLAKNEANYRNAIIAADAIPYKLDYATRQYSFGLELTSTKYGEALVHIPETMVGGIYEETIVLDPLPNLAVEDAILRMREGEGGIYWKAEHRIRSHSGEERWFLDSAAQVLDDNQRPVGSIGILHDITERKQAEIELKIAKSRLQHLLTSSPAVIYSIKPSGDCGATFVSDNIRQLVGYDPAEFLSERGFWINRIHPEDVASAVANLTNFPDSGLNRNEYRFRHKDGRYIWIYDETALIRDEAGRPIELVGCMLSIDQRKAAEAERNAERAFRQTMENSLVSGISVIDMDGVLIHTNPSFCEMVGWTSEELVGQRVPFCYWPPEEHEAIFKIFYSLFGSKIPDERFDMILMRRNGERFPVQLLLSPLYDADQQIGWLGNVIDITERVAQEQLVKAERSRFKSLFELAPHGILIVNSAGQIEMANPALQQMLGLDEALPIRANFFDFITPEYQTFCRQCLEAVCSDRESKRNRVEMTVVNMDGERIPVELDTGFIQWHDTPAAQVIMRNITDRKRAELLEIEQRHIAYELHDGLAQMIAAAHQHLQAYAHRHLPRSQNGREDLTKVVNLVQNSAKEVRRVLAGLRPTALDDFGLITALRLQVQALEAQGWEITYEAPTTNLRLSSNIETIFFRIAQEALTNVGKHAESKRVHIFLTLDDHCCRLEIQDWGRGFDSGRLLTRQIPTDSLGLRGMQDRLSLVNGRLTIQSSPGGGTRVIAEVPCKIQEH